MNTPRHFLALCALALTIGLSGCTALQQAGGEPSATAAKQDEVPPAAAEPTISVQTPAVKAYRKTGAQAIYKKYPNRIYKGKIPPLVYAVVVVETEVAADGTVSKVNFSRTPSHAPEVPPMIAELIMATSPLPNPGKVGAHTYVETWLWDRSGKFQLDTLTLGQRSR